MLQSFRRAPRGLLLVVALAGSFGAGVVAASAAREGESLMADEETLRAIAAVKQGVVEGHRTRDRAALDRLYADDYTAADTRGVRTKEQLLASLPTDPEIVEGQYDLLAARRFGDLAVATGRGRLVRRNPDGSTRTVDYRSFNVFERRGGRWLYVAAFLPGD